MPLSRVLKTQDPDKINVFKVCYPKSHWSLDGKTEGTHEQLKQWLIDNGACAITFKRSSGSRFETEFERYMHGITIKITNPYYAPQAVSAEMVNKLLKRNVISEAKSAISNGDFRPMRVNLPLEKMGISIK